MQLSDNLDQEYNHPQDQDHDQDQEYPQPVHSTEPILPLDQPNSNKPTINHIVLSGGGAFGFSQYGALAHLNKEGYWNIENIKSIHGTSIGAIFGTMISLKYDTSVMDDYILKRPWNKVFNFDMYSVINSFHKRGIFDITVVENMFKPLFAGLDISLNVTMQQLYEYNQIDLHLITTELDDFKTVDISHTTHPEWLVIEAMYASACLPTLFSPFKKDSKYYMDGGILCNYAVENCINLGIPNENILGLQLTKPINSVITTILEDSSLLDYLFIALFKVIHKYMPIHKSNLKNEIQIPANTVSLYDIYLATSSIDERKRLYKLGVDIAKEFISQ